MRNQYCTLTMAPCHTCMIVWLFPLLGCGLSSLKAGSIFSSQCHLWLAHSKYYYWVKICNNWMSWACCQLQQSINMENSKAFPCDYRHIYNPNDRVQYFKTSQGSQLLPKISIIGILNFLPPWLLWGPDAKHNEPQWGVLKRCPKVIQCYLYLLFLFPSVPTSLLGLDNSSSSFKFWTSVLLWEAFLWFRGQGVK